MKGKADGVEVNRTGIHPIAGTSTYEHGTVELFSLSPAPGPMIHY